MEFDLGLLVLEIAKNMKIKPFRLSDELYTYYAMHLQYIKSKARLDIIEYGRNAQLHDDCNRIIYCLFQGYPYLYIDEKITGKTELKQDDPQTNKMKIPKNSHETKAKKDILHSSLMLFYLLFY
jgi:hypothetical protein